MIPQVLASISVGSMVFFVRVYADGSDPLPTCTFDPDDPQAISKHGFQRVPWQDRLSIP